MSQQTDISIFKSTIDLPNKCHNHQSCPAILRLAEILKYYDTLDIVNDEQDKNIFIEFLTNIYKTLIDDYIHLHQNHGHQIEDIYNYFIDHHKFDICKMQNCVFTSRHHAENHQHSNSDHENTEIIDLYKQTIDNVHFYIFHIFDAGLRSLSPGLQNKHDEREKEDDRKDDEYFDAAFHRMKAALSEKRKFTESFPRFGRQKNSKFNIKIEHETNNDDYIENEPEDDIDTFTDSLFNYLSTKGVILRMIKHLQKFMETEEYDTETLAMDISEFGQRGNVSQHLEDYKMIRLIMNFYEFTNSMCSSLSSSMIHHNEK